MLNFTKRTNACERGQLPQTLLTQKGNIGIPLAAVKRCTHLELLPVWYGNERASKKRAFVSPAQCLLAVSEGTGCCARDPPLYLRVIAHVAGWGVPIVHGMPFDVFESLRLAIQLRMIQIVNCIVRLLGVASCARIKVALEFASALPARVAFRRSAATACRLHLTWAFDCSTRHSGAC